MTFMPIHDICQRTRLLYDAISTNVNHRYDDKGLSVNVHNSAFGWGQKLLRYIRW